MIRAEEPDTFSVGSQETLLNEFADHPDKLRMITRRAGAADLHADFFTQMPCSVVKIVEHFHVVGKKTDG